jgi:hypothetical protein
MSRRGESLETQSRLVGSEGTGKNGMTDNGYGVSFWGKELFLNWLW